MGIQRVFLNWDRPGLPAAADYLVERFGSPRTLDLENVVVAVPGGRAGRRLEEILVQRAERQKLLLMPPTIVTVGKLPEMLYVAKKPFAEELVQQLAWVKVLRDCDPECLKRLMPAVPEEDDLTAWLALGAMLGRLHRELAADAMDFEAVADCGSAIEGFREARRWQALAEIQREYLHTLDGLELWDRQTARLFAIQQAECRARGEILLVGLVDMNRSQRLMLDQVADRVTALVFAPQESADRFDEHGCVRPDRWQDVPIDLAADQMEVVGAPTDQAAAVTRAIASLGGRYAAEELVVGVPDQRIVPHVEQHLQQCGLRARYGPGMRISQSAPYRLLAVLAEHLEAGRLATLAALVRHPDVQSWLADKNVRGDWLSEMDGYYTDHLPYRLAGPWLGDAKRCGRIRQVHEAIEALLQGLRGGRQPLDRWGEPIIGVLVEVFGRSGLDRDREPDRTILAACRSVHEVLRRHGAIPGELMPEVTGAEAVQLVLREIAAEMIPPLPDRDAVELLGWLELPLDDAPALIVTGLNEGIVPNSANADLFLPNQLRRGLAIEDNDRRYARDAYALTVLAASRGYLKLIAGQRTAEAAPLTPSRLLFACDEETAARRAKVFFSSGRSPAGGATVPGALQPGRELSEFEPPRPRSLAEPVTSMRVTEFRDYLACPYRYYLKHRLGLGGLSDAGEELDGAAFGSLAHDVLMEFGRSPARESRDAQQIEGLLNGSLDRLVLRRYGEEPLAAVRVQVEQLRCRLAAFARWQADRVESGWQIERVEAGPPQGQAALEVDGRPMVLRGRVDRVDFNPSTGERIILDYKSSDTARPPEKTHRQGDDWIDLQLPLYRHLAKGMGIDGPVGLGYVVLPKDTARVECLRAEWTDDDLQHADRTAAEVIREVRAEVFWPPASPPPAFSEAFAGICGDKHFGSAIAGADEEGGNGQ